MDNYRKSETEGKTFFPLVPYGIIDSISILEVEQLTLSLHTIILHLLINLSEKFTYLVHKLRTSGKPISSHGFAGPLK